MTPNYHFSPFQKYKYLPERLHFIGTKHPGMDFVKQYVSTPAAILFQSFWKDDNLINLWFSMEAFIILGSIIYWVVCYFCSRLILLLAV